MLALHELSQAELCIRLNTLTKMGEDKTLVLPLLVDALQPNKTAPLARVGTAVQRPAGVPKPKAYVKSKPDL